MEVIKWVKAKPKFKINEEVYFVDIFTDFMCPTIRKGKITYADDRYAIVPSSFGINIVYGNNYKIESKGIIYKATQNYIYKTEKAIKKYFGNIAKIEL